MKTLTARLFSLSGIILLAAIMVFSLASCQPEPDPDTGNNNTISSAITYTVAQTGGIDGQINSSGIVFTFSASVDSLNLTAADITVSGKAAKGTAALTGSGTSRTLPITVSSAGTATVSINKTGIETATKSVTVFKEGELVPETVTITWHLDGGTAGIGAQHPTQIDKGDTLAKPSPDPAKDGNTFGGWYTDSGLTQPYNFANAVTANLNLYAKWAAGQINTAHTHQWGDWTATTIEGTEQRVCAIDQSHIEHRLTGTRRFDFQRISNNTSYSVSKGTEEGVGVVVTPTGIEVVYYAVYIPAYYRSNTNSEYLPVTEIGRFAGDPDSPIIGLTAVHIPSTVTSIRYGAFSRCTGLTNITVDSDNPYYTSEGGILYNKAKTEILQYPSASGAITIPAGVTSIGEYAFYNCTGLTSVTIPAGVTSIGGSAFAGCTSLASITIPAGVTSIEGYAFYQCTGLTSITIPAGVTSIGEGAFYYCTSLTSITIPAGVTSIGIGSFGACTSLTNITVDSGNPYYTSEGGILYNKAKTEILQYPSASGAITIPASVTSIGGAAFAGCTSLTSITIPASVTSIGNYAFVECTGLTSITIPAGVTSISNSAFSNCTSLTSVTIPADVTSIGNSAFSNCTSLTSVTIPADVTSIGNSAFSYCTSLTSVTIPVGVTSIGENAFAHWGSTQTIYVVGHASAAAADSAWPHWRYFCDAQIVYQGQ